MKSRLLLAGTLHELRERDLPPLVPLPDTAPDVDLQKWHLPGASVLSGTFAGIRQGGECRIGGDLFFGINVSGRGNAMSEQELMERFLRTDPRDVGCDEAIAVLHVCVDLVAASQDAAGLYPGVAAHLAACGPCNDDFAGLLAAVTSERSET